MTMPPLPGARYHPAQFTDFTHEIEIDWYDGPRAYVKADNKGQHYLATWPDSDDNHWRWIHIPLTPQEMSSVLTGATPLRTAIEEAKLFYVSDEASDGTFTRTNISSLTNPIPAFSNGLYGLPQHDATMNYPTETVQDLLAQLATPPPNPDQESEPT